MMFPAPKPDALAASAGTTRRQLLQLAAASCGALATGAIAQSSEWTARTVKVTVPYAPGSGPDALAREFAEQAAALTQRTFVVENKPGANGMVGTDQVVRGAADGSSLLLMDPLALIANPYVYKSVPFEWRRDLRPIAALADVDLFMFCTPKRPFRTVQDVIGFARQNPGVLNFGTTGNASVEHLSVERFKAHAGIQVTRIPYGGMGQVVPALMSGEIDVFVFGPLPFLAQVREGAVRALVAGSGTRSAVLPNVPTLAEAGLPPDLFIGTTFTMFAPARMPTGMANEIDQVVRTVVSSAKFKEKFAARGLTARHEPQDSVARRLADSDTRLAPLIKSLNITMV